MRQLIIALVAVGALLSCGGNKTDNSLSIDMEPYYYVFGNFLGLSHTRRFMLRVDCAACSPLESGDSVIVVLYSGIDGLLVRSVSLPGQNHTRPGEYWLPGRFSGCDDSTGTAVIRFAFDLSTSEYEATKHPGADSTIIARVYFKPSGDILQFERVEVVGKIGRKPIMYK